MPQILITYLRYRVLLLYSQQSEVSSNLINFSEIETKSLIWNITHKKSKVYRNQGSECQ